KAYRWVKADPATEMGWRPLAWTDVAQFAGPTPELPAAAVRAAGLAGDPDAWTADDVQNTGAALPDSQGEGRDQIAGGFAKLEEQAASPSMGRRLRKLDIPEKVSLAYSGQAKSGDVTFSPLQNQEFSGQLSEMKESIHFVVKAEDFRTRARQITLVPP